MPNGRTDGLVAAQVTVQTYYAGKEPAMPVVKALLGGIDRFRVVDFSSLTSVQIII